MTTKRLKKWWRLFSIKKVFYALVVLGIFAIWITTVFKSQDPSIAGYSTAGSELSTGAASLTPESDIVLWQGQYYNETGPQKGTFDFTFTVYDAKATGSQCYSNTTRLTTSTFGEWKTEQQGVFTSCSNASKEYFLTIAIDGVAQGDRRRLVALNYLRSDIEETITRDITILGTIKGTIVKVQNDLTVGGTGFFASLGSATERIQTLFVTTINVGGTIEGTGGINVSGNIRTSGDICTPTKCLSTMGTGGTQNIFDQALNTTSSVTFASVTTQSVSTNALTADGKSGLTTSSYSVCKTFGADDDDENDECQEWCTLEITDGLITGCV